MFYNVVLVSALQQSESTTHTHIHTIFGFPSHLGHYRAPSRVPYAMLEVLVSDLLYT